MLIHFEKCYAATYFSNLQKKIEKHKLIKNYGLYFNFSITQVLLFIPVNLPSPTRILKKYFLVVYKNF